MTSAQLLLTLVVTAVTIGSLHSAAPDHWMPFAALARARGWSAGRTARMTFFCGFGHVTVSAILGMAGLAIGLEVVQVLGRRLESLAGILLIAFGVAYGIWGLRHAAGVRLHGHAHTHYDHVHETGNTAEWTLFLLFCADPCVAVIPIIIAAAPTGWTGVLTVVVAYEIATIATMILLVLPARAGVALIRARWLESYEHAIAGTFVAAVGVLVGILK